MREFSYYFGTRERESGVNKFDQKTLIYLKQNAI